MLSGKIAVITGAGRGIGRAIALQFTQNGAKVVVNYRNSIAQVEELLDEIKNAGGEAIAVQADISKEAQVKGLIESAVKHFGRLDILVNNAGITKDNLLMRMSEEDFNSVLDINLKGTFLCMKYASSVMLKQRSGKIINISSNRIICIYLIYFMKNKWVVCNNQIDFIEYRLLYNIFSDLKRHHYFFDIII